MSDGISFFSNDDVEKHVKLVMNQTNYTEEEARNKLKLYNSDYLKVLKISETLAIATFQVKVYYPNYP